MFDFNKALKEKEDREETAKMKAEADNDSKTRNIRDLQEGLDKFIASRNFNATTNLRGHKLVVNSKFQGVISVTAENSDLFTVAPEKTDVNMSRSAMPPSGLDLSAEGVTRILVDWIVPKP